MSAALKLEVFQNGEFLREIALSDQELSLGRDSDCAIRLNDRAISRKHAVFRATPQGVVFERKSEFGNVKINGKDSANTTLKVGDRMEVGPFELRVKGEALPPVALSLSPAPAAVSPSSLSPVESTITTATLPENEIPTVHVDPTVQYGFEGTVGIEPLDPGTTAKNPVSEITRAPLNDRTGHFDFAKVQNSSVTRVFNQPAEDLKAILEFSDGTANVSTFDITEREISIGRSQKCHVVLEDKRSSRKHSLIQRQNGKYFVKDLGSANGTLVNGIQASEQELQSGDLIQIGDTQFVFKMVQADFEQKKEQFIQVTHHESEAPAAAAPQMMPVQMGEQFQPHFNSNPMDSVQAAPTPVFEEPKAKKKSILGKFIDRYRAMNTKQQIIYSVVIAGAFWLMIDEDVIEKKAKLNTGAGKPKSAQVKKADKKPGSGQSFENLTPEQQRYIDTEYQLGFDLFKNREYDNSLLEIGKIFSLVQDYKNAREIEAFAREGKRKLEAQEEERKKLEQERQAQLKLQGLIEQVSMLMDKKRFKEAELLFPEIELLQPENSAVSEWRKQMVAQNERIEKAQLEKKRNEETNLLAWSDYKKALGLEKELKYWDALDAFDELLERGVADAKFVSTVKAETKRIEALIAAERDPLLVQGKELEQAGKLTEAYRAYQKALEIDSTNTDAPEGMKRIRGTLTSRAKSVYAEGVFAESYSDLESAEKSYREVMEVVPTDDDYYVKAENRLKKLTVFRRPASLGTTP